MLPSTPREYVNLDGTTVNLRIEEQKGEPDRLGLRIAKFQRSKPKGLTLDDLVLTVDLYCAKYGTFYKGTFEDPREVVGHSKIPMDIVVYILEEILTGGSGTNAVMSHVNDDKNDMLIRAAIKCKMYQKTITYKFCYKFAKINPSKAEQIEMRMGVIEQDMIAHTVENIESRLAKAEVMLMHMEIDGLKIFGIGKPVTPAKFECGSNNNQKSVENGTMLTHTGTNSAWNTSPVGVYMNNTEAYRARFRVADFFNYMMFGVVSSSFAGHKTYPTGSGAYGWMIYFYSGKLSSYYQHNGSFQNAGGPTAFFGSVVTIEYYPKEGKIRYFVNATPAGQHYNCKFNNGNCRFAVSLYHTPAKVKLLSVEKIPNDL